MEIITLGFFPEAPLAKQVNLQASHPNNPKLQLEIIKMAMRVTVILLLEAHLESHSP
jgi:hypothetical protein